MKDLIHTRRNNNKLRDQVEELKKANKALKQEFINAKEHLIQSSRMFRSVKRGNHVVAQEAKNESTLKEKELRVTEKN